MPGGYDFIHHYFQIVVEKISQKMKVGAYRNAAITLKTKNDEG